MKVNNGTLLLIVLLIMVGSSCSVSKQINKQATQILLKDSVISTGHIGISIYEPATDQYWYNYNATRYFVPASNTKLFSLYAGMKYLGDSLIGLRYKTDDFFDSDSPNVIRKQIYIEPTGDPTFLHPNFKKQNVYSFLKNTDALIIFSTGIELEEYYGQGWSWDDYNEDYMVARSAFPIYGNVVNFKVDITKSTIQPNYLLKSKRVFINNNSDTFQNFRDRVKNVFFLNYRSLINYTKSIPIIPEISFVSSMLSDTLSKQVSLYKKGYFIITNFGKKHIDYKIIHSQPSDSLFTPMMHQSDNFFAEQTLLMASNERLGYMNDEAIIDTLLNTDLKDIPQRPQWVDGSGLSRYNLFTPQDFIYILNKLKNDFGWERLKKILPTGGTGTLKRYFNSDSNFIYAKTGTLSNQVALSGFLITRKNKLLVFSVLNNNYEGSTVAVRRAVEQFLKQVRNKY